jgi:V8-like Glu-specific endopeptidase
MLQICLKVDGQMRVTRSLIVLALVFLAGSFPEAFGQDADQDQAIMNVIVWNPVEARFYRRGTAFHVGNSIFYTNAHVVKKSVPEGYTEWYLASTTATRYRSSWVGPISTTSVHPRWRDPGDQGSSHPYDVAQLKAPAALPHFGLPFHDRPPQVGQTVTIKGFPAASRAWPPILYAAMGRISEVRWQDHTFRIDITSGFTLGGSSGSPVLAEDGRVVGIMYAGFGIENRTASTRQAAVFASAALEGCPR